MPCDDNPLGAVLNFFRAACGIQTSNNAFFSTESLDGSFEETTAYRGRETIKRSGRYAPRASLRLLQGPTIDKKEVTLTDLLLYQPAFSCSLIDACKANNLKLVELLLKRTGADANMIDERRETSLVYACMNGNLEAALLLFLYGATYEMSSTSPRDALAMCKTKPNQELSAFLYSVELQVNDETPLSFACSKENLRAIKLLLNHGADANEGEPRPIFSACKSGNISLVRLLLRRKANLNVLNRRGETPLSYACLKGNLDLARLLLKYGSSVTMGRTLPITGACKAGNMDLVQLLFSQYGDLNRLMNDYGSHIPFFFRDADILGRFMDQGGANFETTDGCNLLSYANSEDAVQLLLDRGLKLESTDCFQRSPLHQVESAEAARALIDRGAKVTATDMLGLTPLHYIVGINRRSRYFVLRELLDKGADIHARCLNKTTPLHSACAEDNKFAFDTVGLLLRHGAPVDAVDHSGQTPLHVACFHGVGKYVIGLLLNQGADIHAKNGLMEGPLHLACRAGSLRRDVIQLLLDRGAVDSINDRSCCGQTPLHLLIIDFIRANHKRDKTCDTFEQLVKLLVDRGANINAKNNLGQTPLTLFLGKFPRIVKWKDIQNAIVSPIQWKVMDQLMHLGADVNVPGDRGLTFASGDLREQLCLLYRDECKNSNSTGCRLECSKCGRHNCTASGLRRPRQD